METDFKKYFNFDWNATRTNFWMFLLVTNIISLILAMTGFGALILVLTVALIIPSIAINKARCNDAGWSGWWMLFPFLNWIVMGFFPTKTTDNKYLK